MAKISMQGNKQQKIYDKFYIVKNTLFKFLFKPLTKMGVTPNMVSMLSLLFGAVAAVFLMYDMFIAFFLLMVSYVIDGLDGSLARYQKKDSIFGIFVDAVVDLFINLFVVMVLVHMGLLMGSLGVMYMFLYALIYVTSYMRSFFNKTSNWTVLPRFYFYFMILFYVLGIANLFDFAALVFSLLMVVMVVRDTIVLRGCLDK
ncbi:MAG: CDP-alcohol phosphatidyltransferase family protein [archaeon]